MLAVQTGPVQPVFYAVFFTVKKFQKGAGMRICGTLDAETIDVRGVKYYFAD